MSHLKERKEKICLNCNTELFGRYCHVCGQENLEPKETVWHLVNHFFQDITHFDGKFFSTVKLLLTKPGFLSKEYMVGRRASYLNPIRMYVFTSAIFFLIFFSLTNPDSIMKLNEQSNEKKESIADWEKSKASLQKKLEIAKREKDGDSSDVMDDIEEINIKIVSARKIYGDTTTRKFTNGEAALLVARASLDSLKQKKLSQKMAAADNRISGKDSVVKTNKDDKGLLDDDEYTTPAAYDSAQRRLSLEKRDGWLKTMIKRKMYEINAERHKDQRGFYEHTREKFIHSFPKIFFISLPFFALILKLVYIRRKQFYYTNHGIFTIHVYCAAFILLIVMILLGQVLQLSSWKWLHTIVTILDTGLWIYLFIYLYKAMRKFYGQRRFKTILKYLMVSLFALILNALLLVVFALISAISV